MWVHWRQSPPNLVSSHPPAPHTEQQLWPTWCHGKACFETYEMLYLIRRGERVVGMHGCALQTWGLHSKTFLAFAQSCKTLHCNYFPLPPLQKKGRAQHWSSFQRMVCFISPQCSSAFGENVAVVLLKNNKSYGIPLNWANVGSVGRRDTERFKVLVWRKRFWIKQFYVILQVVWAIILYVRLYHCSLECSYNTDLIMHRKKISHLLDSFLLFKSRKEQKGSYFLKEIVRFYCRKVAACAELEL